LETEISPLYLRPHAYRPMNRLGDVILASFLLLFTLPLMLTIAIAIKVESPGPVSEGQACIGARGRRFQLLGFRTTAADSTRVQPSTRIGRFLRYSRIESLPQLINLLRGDLGVLDSERRSPSFLH
jgi:putative colanic acid biosynthesis UDP-glucose lipid carrier transferase